jgi:hypothetical protein
VDSIAVDVSDFQPATGLVNGLELMLVVKSLDQQERRQRLIEARHGGRLGRIAERPISEGLVVRARLCSGRALTAQSAELVRVFREPRGLIRLNGDELLIAEIDRVVLTDADCSPRREYRHPYFGFLHSVQLSPDGERFLVVSSGFDALVEVERETGTVTWEWFSWEHGFNPNLDGVYLTRSRHELRALEAKGSKALLVDPTTVGAHGLLTSQRSNHPNSACYHPRRPGAVLVTLGHSGQVIEVERSGGAAQTRVTGLGAMPHGIMPFGDGWMVTNTLHGECWRLGPDFEIRERISFARLPGKPPGMGEHEWVQAVYPLGEGRFLAIDANRGLILADTMTRRYEVVPADPDWSVHHVVVIAGAAT